MHPDTAPRGTRRQFLTRTAAAGATAFSGLSLARSAHAAGTQQIKIGMIGCGGRCSGAAAQALSLGKDVKLAAMSDVFESRMLAKRRFFQSQYPQQFIATDDTCRSGLDGYQRVIEASDAVLIACASKFHGHYAEQAVQVGKHVFIEKPMAIDPAGCHRLRRACDLAREKNVSIVSGLESRYSLGYREQVQRIHDGAIGHVVAIQSTFLRSPYRTEAPRPDLTETQYQFWNWYHFRWLSGDDVTQSLVHNFDRMRWVLREENPTRCFALGGRSSSFGRIHGDMFDHGTVVYEFASGPRLYGMTRTQMNCYGSWDDIIMGTKGVCYWSACRIEGEHKWRYAGPKNDPNLGEQERLVGAIRAGTVINDGDTMIDSTRMAIMGQLACYGGNPIGWDDMLKADFEFEPKLADTRLDMPPPVTPDAGGNYPVPMPGITRYF